MRSLISIFVGAVFIASCGGGDGAAKPDDLATLGCESIYLIDEPRFFDATIYGSSVELLRQSDTDDGLKKLVARAESAQDVSAQQAVLVPLAGWCDTHGVKEP